MHVEPLDAANTTIKNICDTLVKQNFKDDYTKSKRNNDKNERLKKCKHI